MLETTVLEKPKHDVGVLNRPTPILSQTGLPDGFDPYDSSHVKYSERLEEVTDKAMFQYKFRKRAESGMPNPSEPVEYQRAMAENNRKLKQFFKEDGSFDMSSYVGSDVFYERQKLGNEKLLRKIVRDMNNDVNKEFAETVKEIKITKYASDKAQYIAQRVSELARNIGKGDHYEIAMYMLDDSLAGREHNIVTRDVYIGQEQIDEPSHCDITPLGKIRSFRETTPMKKRIVGFAHSHGNIDTYFSPEDDTTLRSLLNSWRIKKTLNNNELFFSDASIEYFTAFVVNDRADEPAYRIVAKKPRFYIEDGIVKKTSDDIDLNRTTSQNGNHRNKWPFPVIIDSGNYNLNTAEIDNQIIERVKFSDGTRLRDYYKDKGGNLIVILPEHDDSKYDKETKDKTQDYIKNVLKKETKKPSQIPDRKKEGHGLTERVARLENEPTYFKENYKRLQERVAYLETQPINKGLSYSANMQNYYTRFISSENVADNMLGTISKIMAGQYYSDLESIKESNYMEYASPTRIWKWEDRVEAIMEIYGQNKDLFSQLNNGLIGRLKEILNSNRYLRKKHGDKLERIVGLFDN